MARGSFLLGAAVAVGAVMLVPGAGAALARAGRPLVRAAMKTGTTAWDEFRRAGAEAYEHFEDLAAEVKAETAKAAGDGGDPDAAAAAAAAAAAGFTGAAGASAGEDGPAGGVAGAREETGAGPGDGTAPGSAGGAQRPGAADEGPAAPAS